MAMQRSNWEPPSLRAAMLAKIGEVYRRDYANVSEAMPDNIIALIRRLDEKTRPNLGAGRDIAGS
jgi:hypothetical protein